MEADEKIPGSILCLISLPGGGKTTLAKKMVAEDPSTRVRINYDDLRLELYGKDWTFNRDEEKAMKAIAIERAEAALAAGKDVIVDNTNLTDSARAPWEALAKRVGVPYDSYELNTSIDECVERDKLRGEGRVGRAVIERFALFTGHIDWDDERYGNKMFVIFDVDGTLADTSKRQNYVRGASTAETPFKKDYGKFFAEVHLDEPKESIINLCKDFNALEYNILVVSGRPIDPCGIPTEDWLFKHGIPLQHLFMRQGYDHRPDDVIKQEILDLLPIDRIAYVIDDRNRVVDMWRKNGLTCLQCAPGDF